MTTLIVICVGFWAIKAGIKAWQEAEVRKSSPEVWARLREIDHQERLMRRESMKSAAGFGLSIAKMFMGK